MNVSKPFKTLKHKVVGDAWYREFKFRRIDRLKGVERTSTVYCHIKDMMQRKQIKKRRTIWSRNTCRAKYEAKFCDNKRTIEACRPL